jgi:phosphocarrier protein HPr
MPTRTVTVGSASGLHARPAAVIAAAVAEAGEPVSVAVDGGDPVDAGSAMMLMTLGTVRGSQVTIGCDDRDVLDRIAELMAADLDA